MAVTGHAIGGLDPLDRGADIAARADPADPRAVLVQFDEGVRDRARVAGRLALLVEQTLRFREDRDVIVRGRPGEGVHGEHQRPGIRLQSAAEAGPVVDGRDLGAEVAVQPALGRLGRDTIVDDVDHAADGRAAEGQSRRAPNDLDAARLGRIDSDLVVGRDRAGVDHAKAVGQHLHPRSRQTADHGTAGARSEIGAAHPGQAIDQIAQGRGGGDGQVFLVQHLDRQQAGAIGDPERRAGDDDVPQRRGALPGRSLGGGGAGEGGPAGGGEQERAGGTRKHPVLL